MTNNEVVMTDQLDNDQRMKVINELSKRLNNGWNLTVHFKNKMWSISDMPNWQTIEEFLDSWEKEKPIYLDEFAAFIDDFGIAALIACTNTKTREDEKYDEPAVWFMSPKTQENICFINDINIWPSSKLIEIFINA